MNDIQKAAILLNAGAVAIAAKKSFFRDHVVVPTLFMQKLHQSLRDAGFDIDDIRAKEGSSRI